MGAPGELSHSSGCTRRTGRLKSCSRLCFPYNGILQGNSVIPCLSIIPAGTWGPRCEKLVGSLQWIRAATAGSQENFPGHTLPSKLYLCAVTVIYIWMFATQHLAIYLSWDGLLGDQSWRISGPIINMLKIVTDLSPQCWSPSLFQSFHVLLTAQPGACCSLHPGASTKPLPELGSKELFWSGFFPNSHIVETFS